MQLSLSATQSGHGSLNCILIVKGRCFDPFPLCTEEQKKRIRSIAEELDAHRKRVQAHHGLTLTGMYNVLEKLRSGSELTAKEKLIHDNGLVSVLQPLHDDLDAAVFAAYGWPETLTDAEILQRLVTSTPSALPKRSKASSTGCAPSIRSKAPSRRESWS
jgi:hypothetical protein